MPQRAGAGWTPHTAAVLEAVETIPPGRVLSYGDVAELAGHGAARSVGLVMARWGAEVAWWRVVRRDGSLPPVLLPAALQRWREEGTPVRSDGAGADMTRARWSG